MNNPARHGCSYLAGALLLAGCKSGPARVDGLAISRLRPGHTRFEDVEALLGQPTSVHEWVPENATIARYACWGPRCFDWVFYLRPDGTVHQFEPHMYTWTLSAGPGDSLGESDLPPYRPPKAVAPECAQLFVPGLTTQSEVVAAWGQCSHAEELAEGRYRIRWGSDEDHWYLEFDPDGLLRGAPRHVPSR